MSIETRLELSEKYQYSGNTMEVDGTIVYEIESLVEFSVTGKVVKKGDKGGWVEDMANLSQSGNCWVFPYCIVLGNAHVKDSAVLRYGSVARDNALIFGDAIVTESLVAGNSKIGDFAQITDAAMYDNSEMTGHASMVGHAVFNAIERIKPHEGDTYLSGFARLSDYAQIFNGVAVEDYAMIRGHIKLCGPIKIRGEAIIEKWSEDDELDEFELRKWMVALP